MDDKTLTKAFCTIKRMRLGSVNVKQHIDEVYGSEENLRDKNPMFNRTMQFPGMKKPIDLIQALYNAADKKVNTLELDSSQLHMNVTIDFDETTTFEIVVWNLKDEKEIIVGDQLEIKLFWENYTRPADTLTVSGFVTTAKRKVDGADMCYTITGDMESDWAMTYLTVESTPLHIRTTVDLLNAVRPAGIRMIKTPDGTLHKQFLIKDKTSIRDVLNTAATGFGNNYTWTLLNDVIIFHMNGEPLSQSLDVISLNNSDVIEYEIEDDRMHLKTFGLPELDIGSIFKYLDKAYFVDTIKHTFTHDGGYLCDIYSGEKTENGNAEQSFIDESAFIED